MLRLQGARTASPPACGSGAPLQVLGASISCLPAVMPFVVYGVFSTAPLRAFRSARSRSGDRSAFFAIGRGSEGVEEPALSTPGCRATDPEFLSYGKVTLESSHASGESVFVPATLK